MRFVSLMMAAVMTLTCMSGDADAASRKKRGGAGRVAASSTAAVSDARYADIILNPVTGEVYHSANADGRRYPASLTKMMTLYMLFDALEKRKVTLNTKLDVSEYAATMPQTNLALDGGDEIPVETAIKALVVRSANDVAVVVAEALGGDVDRFAEMMTAKARQLGMNGTVFQNPNGLPNNGQYTTARDMAKLGIALKRDFPQYYPYFNVRQFSWNGVTYYTHNRVMLRYPGTDGIKTGFIGASGFNLVSSVTRGGRPLVGVVLGGSTGAWRDSRMIALLDASYKIIAERGAVRGKVYAENLPLPLRSVGKAGQGIALAQVQNELLSTETEGATPVPEEAEDGMGDTAPAAPVPFAAAARATAAPTPANQPVVVAAPASVAGNAPAVVVVPNPAAQGHAGAAKLVTLPDSAASHAAMAPAARAPLPAGSQQAALAPAVLDAAGSNWGIQVGAFSTHDLAEQAARQAVQTAASALQGARIAVLAPAPNGASVHRARVENISQLQARKACQALISSNAPCFIYKAEAGGV